MDETHLLKLPYILAAQSQKHVTHNEALRALDALVHLAVQDMDLNTPPGSPSEGDRYIVGPSPSGGWSGHARDIAAYQGGAWAFYEPVTGWRAWVADEDALYVFNGGSWLPVSSGGGGGGGSVNPVSLVGVNAVADATNRLSVVSPATLFNHEGAGHQLKINKAAAGDTGSVVFQTGFSGRAEFGLAGDDDFHVKVSADGSAWHEALVISRSSGAVRAKAAQVDVASAATCNIGAATAQRVRITGTTTITSFGTVADELRFVTFAGALTLTHNGTSLILPAAANIVTAAGDTAIFASDGSGNWRCLAYQRATGEPLVSPASGSVNPNLITNGDGAINQRSASTNIADDTYAWDRHYVLTQTNPVTVSTLTDVADGVPHLFRLTQSHATAQRMGAASILEARDSKVHRAGTVTLSGKARMSSAATVRWAILEWTGTEDAVTSDVVSSWTSGTYTAGNFFLGSNLTVAAAGSLALSANALTDFSLPATISSSCSNLIVVIWTSATAAQTVTLDWRWKLERGGTATPWAPRPRVEEMHRCFRHYLRLDSSSSAYATFGFGYAGSTTQAAVSFTFQVEMFATPAFSYSGALSFTQGALNTVSGVYANRLTPMGGEMAFSGTGFTSGAAGKAQANNSTAVYVAFEAEL